MTRRVLSRVGDDQLALPTPCKSWCVRDVIDHLIAENQLFAETIALKPPEVNALPGDGVNRLVYNFDAACASAVEAFSAPGAMEKMVTMAAGEYPATIYLALATCENFVHGWDLADAIDMRSLIDDELAELLLAGPVVRGLKDEMRGPDREASFGTRKMVGDDATFADELAAFFGRTV
jgi:uncharacterized protein (TIGR03086 family)